VQRSGIATSKAAALAVMETSSVRMKTLWRVFGLLLLALTLMSLARAGNIVTITLDPNFPGDYHYYSYTSGGVTYNEPTGPYPATLTGGIYGTGTLAYVVCFDFNIETLVGTTYNGSLTTPSGPAQIEVAWLMQQLTNAGGYYAPISTSGPISLAIWQLENASSPNGLTPFPNDPAAQPWVNNAIAAYNNGNGPWTAADAAQFPYWSPSAAGAEQRFGIEEVVSPEPGSFALVGASLIGVGLLLRKRLARS
jgi:hypothetical protein